MTFLTVSIGLMESFPQLSVSSFNKHTPIMRHSNAFIFFFVLASFSFSTYSYAQQAPRIEWQRCLGGSKDEDGGGGPSSRCIVQTSDGGYILTGSTVSRDGDVSGLHDTINGDIWVVKLSSSGSIEWQKCLGGSHQSIAYCIIQTSDKGYAIAGSTSANDGDVTGWHPGFDTSFGSKYPHADAWFIKLDSLGNIQWQKCLGGSGIDAATSIIQTSDGGYAVTGTTTSNDGDMSGNHGNYDEFVIKLSSSGVIQWQKCYGGRNGDWGVSIIQTYDGGYITAGWTGSNDEGSFINHGHTDIYIVKIDSLGNLQWQKCYGGSFNDEGFCILQTADRGYVFIGYTQSSDGEVSGYHGVNQDADAWLVRIDSIGKILWQRSLGGSRNDVGSSIIQPSDGGFIIAGSTASIDGDVIRDDPGGVWILKLNSSGIIQWQRCLGGNKGLDNGTSIIQTNDGGYALAGITSSNDGDVSGLHYFSNGAPSSDIWVIKLSPAIIDKVESTTPEQSLHQPYPNPSTGEVRIDISSSLIPQKLDFFDALGNRCYPQYTLENNIALVNVQSLASGIYMVKVGSQTTPFIVQH